MSDFIVKQIRVGGFDSNFSYLVAERSSGEAVVIDPCGEVSCIKTEIAGIPGIKAKAILLTHGHFDHVSGLGEIRNFFPAKIAAHPKSPVPHDISLEDGEKLSLGHGFIEAIHAPGHTEDGIVYRLSDDSAIFTGDTLFIDCIGYCKPKTMFKTLSRIKLLPDSNIVFSGHDYGSVPSRSLGEEKRLNPYLASSNIEDFTEMLRTL